MNRMQMIKLLDHGKLPIDVSIRKWREIVDAPTNNHIGTRHQLDEGVDNCALCYSNRNCKDCIVYKRFSVSCGEAVKNTKKYKKDFYSQYLHEGNKQAMLDALILIKNTSKWYYRFKAFIGAIKQFLSFLMQLISSPFKRLRKVINYD